MTKTFKKQKALFAIVVTVLLVFSLSGYAGAAANLGTSNNSAVFSLDTYALHTDQETRLYVNVLSADGIAFVPAVLKEVQVKITGTDGQLASTKNYHNVSSTGGQAVIDLGDVALNDTVATQVLAQTDQTVNTEVLNDITAATDFAVMPNQAVTSGFKGYGSQMNGYVYTALNDPSRGFTGNQPPANMSSLESKVAELKPGLSRIFLAESHYDPSDLNMQNRMDSFYKTVELAQKVGAGVNITWWYTPSYPDPDHESVALQADMQNFADTLTDSFGRHADFQEWRVAPGACIELY